jgi:acyl-CoA reductase-like NAD-dependent aldehyde dehydrogenase
MSTDIVLIERSILEDFRRKVFGILEEPASHLSITPVISDKSSKRIRQILEDAKSKGAKLTEFPAVTSKAKSFAVEDIVPATIIEGLDHSMSFYSQEAFGPLLGIFPVASPAEAAQIINKCTLGLSASIFTRNHFAALKLSRQLQVGAIHVNGATVHDESTLPHGGHGDSGWGRFGANWGLGEFVQTKTVILNA